MEKKKLIFPQANDPYKILKIFEMTEEDLNSNEIIKEKLGFSADRQVNYYLSALEYFGFIENRTFTDAGNKIRFLTTRDKKKYLIKEILRDDIFYEVFYEVVFLKKNVTIGDIENLLIISQFTQSESVARRRASTVKKWIEWINNEILVRKL